MADTQQAQELDDDKGLETITDVARGLLNAMNVEGEVGKQTAEIVELLAEGATIGDIYGVEHKDLELIYSMARTVYDNRKFEDALTLFRFLVFMDNQDVKYLIGLGATQQQLGQYQDAVNTYAIAMILDVEDPRPHLQAGYCLMKMGKDEEAICALQAAADAPNATEVTKVQSEALITSIQGHAPEEATS